MNDPNVPTDPTDPADPADQAFADLVARAKADPCVLGLVLHGSRVFEGMPTPHSDYDVSLIVDESEQGARWQRQKTSLLDFGPTSLSGLRSQILEAGDEDRYISGHARVVIDRLDGQIEAIVREVAAFPTTHLDRLPDMLDGYLNLFYRSLKSWRDDHTVEAHLDGAASVSLALWVIFALHRRVRPPNKYLIWDLERHPLGAEPWDVTRLVPRVQRILAQGDPDTQRELFHDIEPAARTAGLGETVDAWGRDLDLMRGVRTV